jgi:hypothetical protein
VREPRIEVMARAAEIRWNGCMLANS